MHLIDNILLVIQAVYQSTRRQEFIWRNCLGKVFFMSLEREGVYQVESEPGAVQRDFWQTSRVGWDTDTWSTGSSWAMCETGHVRRLQVCIGEIRECLKHCQALCICPCNNKESSSNYRTHLQIICMKTVNLTLHDSSKEWNHSLMYKVIAGHFSPP